jgi:hypothetical protein
MPSATCAVAIDSALSHCRNVGMLQRCNRTDSIRRSWSVPCNVAWCVSYATYWRHGALLHHCGMRCSSQHTRRSTRAQCCIVRCCPVAGLLLISGCMPPAVCCPLHCVATSSCTLSVRPCAVYNCGVVVLTSHTEATIIYGAPRRAGRPSGWRGRWGPC